MALKGTLVTRFFFPLPQPPNLCFVKGFDNSSTALRHPCTATADFWPLGLAEVSNFTLHHHRVGSSSSQQRVCKQQTFSKPTTCVAEQILRRGACFFRIFFSRCGHASVRSHRPDWRAKFAKSVLSPAIAFGFNQRKSRRYCSAILLLNRQQALQFYCSYCV